ncbi:hypothetical protein O9929_13865 [Vibrio lentus]|nr:hypothetical protein [Vibrio lentus]
MATCKPVSAMKAGAYDFLEKPFVVDALLTAVKHLTAGIKWRREQSAKKRTGG